MKTQLATKTPSGILKMLNDVEVANLKKNAAKDQVSEFIEQVGQLAFRHGIDDCIGIHLLHRHDNPSDDSILHREFSDIGMKVSHIEPTESIFPSSWLFIKDETGLPVMMPIEWASDELSKNQYNKLMESEFIDDFSDLLEKYELLEIFGLTLAWDRGLNLNNEGLIVEQTSLSEGEFEANIVTKEPPENLPTQDLIMTNWFYNEGVESWKCGCAPGGCDSYTTYCVPRAPGHSIVRICDEIGHRRTCLA